MRKEEWRTIENYPEYQVSSFGNVKSLKFGEERVLKQGICNGYCLVGLHKEGKRKNYFVHRLVATAFLPNPDNLPCINHKNEIKTDNCVDNLEFCTYQYNNIYGTKLERISKANKGKKQSQEHIEKKVKSHQKTILQLSKSGNIILCKWESATQAEKELNILATNITKCCRGKYKTAGKYKWMYYEDYINKINNYFNLALKEVS